MNSSDLPCLGSGPADRIAAALRSVVSSAPVIGGLLSEIVTELIPSQRLDRVEKFLLVLAQELQRIGKEPLLPKQDGPKLELLESGIRAASTSSSSDKIRWLAKCVALGLSEDDADAMRAQRVMRIVAELDPEELIVLLLHTKNTINEAFDFRSQHPAIFDFPRLTLSANEDIRKRNAEYEAAERHLIGLGLLSEEIKFDRDTGLAKLSVGRPEVEVDITTVGRLVLQFVGLTTRI